MTKYEEAICIFLSSHPYAEAIVRKLTSGVSAKDAVNLAFRYEALLRGITTEKLVDLLLNSCPPTPSFSIPETHVSHVSLQRPQR